MMPITVQSDADVAVVATGHLMHLCPFVDEVDAGRVEITWRCDGQTFELHSLADYLISFSESTLSHEAITDRIRADLSVYGGLTLLNVITQWTTAGLGVTCSTSPTRAEKP